MSLLYRLTLGWGSLNLSGHLWYYSGLICFTYSSNFRCVDSNDFVSGSIDATVWILVYGLIGLVVFGIFKGVKGGSASSSLRNHQLPLSERLALLEEPRRILSESEIASGWYDDPSEIGATRFYSAESGWTDRIKGHLSEIEYEQPRYPVVIDGVETQFLKTLHPPIVYGEVEKKGWFNDPLGDFECRFWDGSRWTNQVKNGDIYLTQAFDALIDADTNSEILESIVDQEPEFERPTKSTDVLEIDKLITLVNFYQNGLLSDEEFLLAKEKLFKG